MEPLKPEVRQAILASNPDATPGEIDEYEQLLAERFARDPDVASEPSFRAEADQSTARLSALYAKLFPGERRPPRE